MSYKVLARKWRPSQFSELVGQRHITRSLQKAIEKKEVGQAYLFCGTRGVGKTTLARVFAKALQCDSLSSEGEPCGKCLSCNEIDNSNSLDYVEIDGASNNSVDDIRSLIENIQYLPVRGDKKVYVIDEVHMLSSSAFNALLKTLEEPPAHVIFILATTNPEKIPPTVLSRCQRFEFRNAKESDLVGLLKEILEKESIEYESEFVLQELSRLGKGSFRDTLSLVEQVKCFSIDNRLTEDLLEDALGVPTQKVIENLNESLIKGNGPEFSERFEKAIQSNIELSNLIFGLLDHLYRLVRMADRNEAHPLLEDVNKAELIWMYENLAKDLTFALESIEPTKVAEVALLKIAARREFFSKSTQKKTESVEVVKAATEVEQPETSSLSESLEVETTVEATPEKNQVIENIKIEESEEDSPHTEPEQTKEVNASEEDKKTNKAPANLEKNWQGFLQFLFQQNKVLESNLAQGNLIDVPDFSSRPLNLTIGFSKSAAVFTEILNQRKTDLTELVSTFFEVPQEQVAIQISVVGETQTDFKSQVQIEEEEIQKTRQDSEDRIRANPHILKAQELFNSQLDKVVLNN